jgi:cytochrome P450
VGNVPVTLGPEYIHDPYSAHDRLRTESPVIDVVMPNGVRGWLVTRYADVRAALADPRLVKDRRKFCGGQVPGWQSTAEAILSGHMLNLDPPDHERLRRLVSKAFTPRRVEQLRPRVEEITGSLLDALSGTDQVDLLETFVFPLPVIVIGELLGVPAEDRDNFRAWSAAAVCSTGDPAEAAGSAETMIEYLTALLGDKRATPADDLLSALIEAQESGDRLTEIELLAMVFLLLAAAHETTVNLIASGTLALLLNPAERDRLLADRSLLPSAVEELLRYVTPVSTATARFTIEPAGIGGVTIPPGQVVLVALSGANWDPARYAAPETLDLTRDTSGHMAFGHGIHYCLGAPLARMEAEIALGALLDRFPSMTLAVPPTSLRWRFSTLIRGLEALPVRPAA